MMNKTVVAFFVSLGLAVSPGVFAGDNEGGGSGDDSNNQQPQGGGGNGGNGGNGGSGGNATGGNSQATSNAISANTNVLSNISKNDNTNVNTVRSTNRNNNENSNQQGQDQRQQQQQDQHQGQSQTSTSSVTNSGNSANRVSQGQTVDNAGNNTGTANVVVQGDQAQARNPVSTAYAPSITTGNDQCLVVVSGGAQVVGFGVSFGTAIRDEVCEAIKLSKLLFSYGYVKAAIKILTDADPRIVKAFE